MTTLELGPVRLLKVGDFARAAKDPSIKAPSDVAAKFPAKAENLRRDPSGTWYATVEEEVTVVEDGRKVKRPRHRIHWLAPEGDVLAAKDLEVFHELAFGPGEALLTGDRGKLWRLSLDDGRLTELPLEGFTFDAEARLYEIFVLAGTRVIVSERAHGIVLVAERTPKGLEHRTTFPFKGSFAVVGGRFLVGGAKTVHAFDLAADPVEVGSTTEIGVTNLWSGPQGVRLYSGKTGAWDVKVPD